MAQDDDSLYLMSPLETATCILLGHTGSLPPSASGIRDPRRALEHVVRNALLRPPCGVAFSGGRDSSAVLAVAARVARCNGLPLPIPITKVFPLVPSAEEGSWQESVVRHVGLDDWQRVVIHDELDLVGPRATANLIAHGVVWPPMIHGDAPVVELVPGGSVIDGEGGDEVLGVGFHRIAPVTHLLREPRPLQRSRVRRAVEAVLPAAVRARRVRREWLTQPLAWLRPAARMELAAALGEVERRAPLSFARSVRRVPRRRSQVLGARNRQYFARSVNVEMSSPLLHPDVVGALAQQGGVLGRGDRAATLSALVSDLLPHAVIARTDKASFGGAFWSRHARSFAERWNGDGVDTELVDPDELRRSWLSDRPDPNSSAVLQQAWLATEGRGSRPSEEG